MEEGKEVKFLEPLWFEESPEGWVLVGTRCEACGKVSFPRKYVCPGCFSEDLKTVPLSKKGTLHTYSFSVMGPPDLEKPFVVGFVDLPEKVKLFSLITGYGPDAKDLEIGMEMDMVLGPVKKDVAGNHLYGYKFTPAKRGTWK